MTENQSVRRFRGFALAMMVCFASSNAQAQVDEVTDLPDRAWIVVSLVDQSFLRAELLETTRTLHRGLQTRMGIEAENITVMVGDEDFSQTLASDEIIATVADKTLVIDSIQSSDESDRAWLFWIGYASGTEGYQFHVAGPDLNGNEISSAIKQMSARTKLVWFLTPCSGVIIEKVSDSNTVIVTATESIDEINGTRMTEELASLLDGTDAIDDVDADGRTTVLDWYASACLRLQRTYAANDLILSEHALLDDDGDGRGTPVHLRLIETVMVGDGDDRYAIDLRQSPVKSAEGALAATIELMNKPTE